MNLAVKTQSITKRSVSILSSNLSFTTLFFPLAAFSLHFSVVFYRCCLLLLFSLLTEVLYQQTPGIPRLLWPDPAVRVRPLMRLRPERVIGA